MPMPQQPPRRVPPEHHALVRRVAHGLRHRVGVREGDALVVGCSGGGDSVALLRALRLLSQKRTWRLRLVVAHVNHHLRETAERDATFVEALAGTLGLGFARRDVDCAARAAGDGEAPPGLPGNLEARARSLRYAALADVAAEHHARWIATAHHADDQLETVLMRLMRGAGTRGLRGIAWRRRLTDAPGQLRLIRPMLAVPRDTARAFLAELGQPWLEDETNTDLARRRARLRHELMPLLRRLAPDLASRTTDLHDHFAALHRLVRDTASPRRLPLARDAARSLNPAVLGEVLRRELLAAGVPRDRLTRAALAPLLRAARDNAGGSRRFGFGAAAVVLTAEGLRLES